MARSKSNHNTRKQSSYKHRSPSGLTKSARQSSGLSSEQKKVIKDQGYINEWGRQRMNESLQQSRMGPLYEAVKSPQMVADKARQQSGSAYQSPIPKPRPKRRVDHNSRKKRAR